MIQHTYIQTNTSTHHTDEYRQQSIEIDVRATQADRIHFPQNQSRTEQVRK